MADKILTDHTHARLIVAYILVAILTFGHAWSRIWVTPGLPGDLQTMQRISGAGFVCMAWPLYWSVQAFGWARNGDA